ncbi:DUF2892 domain-containing protein [candidate division KSB1 bacterium]|nr:DUF2892 domain-containing protein [candidate division KSB1 bacterium]
MKRNVGIIDKAIRIVVGLALIILALIDKQWWWGAIGLVLMITGFINRCLLYLPFKISTYKAKEKES